MLKSAKICNDLQKYRNVQNKMHIYHEVLEHNENM
jgi:hypothetical protein